MNNDILGKVIQSQEQKIKSDLNLQELIDFLLQNLTSREKDIIKARYGLRKEKRETLESIGKNLGITRERVRQIANSALKKAKNTKHIREKLSGLINLVYKNISEYGNIRAEDSLFSELLENSLNETVDKNRLLFIFNYFLVDDIQPVDIIHTEKAWALKNKNLDHYPIIIEGVKNILKRKNEPLEIEKITDELEEEIIDNKVKALIKKTEDLNKLLHSYLEVSKHFKKNLFDKWGLLDWRLVNPKRMRDKIYLVLLKDKKPLHYKKITKRINEEQFDHKKAYPPTIHNELILDNRFVLVGRGIYALAEWGYKPGILSEVIKEVLQKAGKPLTRDKIVKEVLKRRMVKEGSINLTLMNSDLFEKLEDDRYGLKS